MKTRLPLLRLSLAGLLVTCLCTVPAHAQEIEGLQLVPEDARPGVSAASVPPGPWTRVETDDFRVVGNASVPRLVQMATDLEHLRRFFARLAPGVDLEGPVPFLIYAFADEESLAPYRSSSRGAGYFLSRPHRNYAVINGGPDVDASRLLYREYIHQLLAADDEEHPFWWRWGLESFFSTFSVEDGIAIVGRNPGLILANRARSLRQSDTPLTLTELLTADAADEDSGRLSQEAPYDAWLLTHWILTGRQDRPPGLADYRRRQAAGEEAGAAFRAAFPDFPEGGLEALSEEYRQRRIGGEGSRELHMPVGDLGQVVLATFPMTPAQVFYRLADLRIEARLPAPTGSGRPGDEARRLLEAALSSATEGDGPAPLDGIHLDLGQLAEQAGDMEAALEHYGRAVEILAQGASGRVLTTAAERAQAHFLYGSALLEALGNRRPGNPQEEARLVTAQEALARAAELAPWRPEVWVQRTRAYGLDAKPKDAELEVVAAALERFPSRPDLLTNAALAYGRRGQRQPVEEIYGRLQELDAEPASLARVEEILLRLDFHLADRLVHQDQVDDAVGLFARIQSRTRDPRLRQQVAERIALLERAERYNRFVELFVDGFEQLSAGDLEAARERVEQLRQLARPGRQQEAVDDLAAAVERADSDP